ncbi:MAG: TerC family protein [Chloroflexi bacterium]|nr:TerC family protein [Chloroflexota bacterium]
MATRELLMFGGFTVVVGLMLYVDLFLVNRKAHVITIRSALIWSAIWICASLLFNVFVYFELGSEKALEYFTAYILEKSLSVDNLFVFLVVFTYFGIGPLYQPRVLRWGILGAIFLRATLIVIGIELVHAFNWMLYVFGAILILTAYRLLNGVADEVEPGKNAALRLVSRYLPLTTELHAERFLVRLGKVLYATPLLATLVVIESTDVLFALDSIPAVLGISHDLFIVYTSNIFAILGLRALYFALAGVMQLFHYLKYSLAIILGFIGVKMIIHDLFKIPIEIALGVVFGLLALAIVASILFPKKDRVEAGVEQTTQAAMVAPEN